MDALLPSVKDLEPLLHIRLALAQRHFQAPALLHRLAVLDTELLQLPRKPLALRYEPLKLLRRHVLRVDKLLAALTFLLLVPQLGRILVPCSVQPLDRASALVQLRHEHLVVVLDKLGEIALQHLVLVLFALQRRRLVRQRTQLSLHLVLLRLEGLDGRRERLVLVLKAARQIRELIRVRVIILPKLFVALPQVREKQRMQLIFIVPPHRTTARGPHSHAKVHNPVQ